MKDDSQRLARLTPRQRDAAREASRTLELLLTPRPTHNSPARGFQKDRHPPTATPVSLPPLRSSLSALRFASPALRNDVHVVMAAVQKDGQALEYASAELQGHPGVVLAAVQQGGTGVMQSVDPPPEVSSLMADSGTGSWSELGVVPGWVAGEACRNEGGVGGEADTRSALSYRTGGDDDVRVVVSVVHRAEYGADDESSVEIAC